MKNDDPPSDPLVVSAKLNGDDLELVLTPEGMTVLEEMRAHLAETDPDADYEDVLLAAMDLLLDELRSQN